MCSRLRRGILYRVADELGASKIALGHHRDDILETLMLNMFYAGKLKAMPPKLRSDDGKHIVIRPLAYVPEKLLERYAADMNFPIIPCDLCGSQPNLQRQVMKEMLRDWEKKHPGRVENLFRSMHHIVPSHLMDGEAFDFQNLEISTELSGIAARSSGDKAIDEAELDELACGTLIQGTYNPPL